MQNWSPSSWREKPIRHVPVYGHEVHLHEVEKTIATYMLLECWKDEAEHQMLDEYHWINDTGCLDVEDIQAIAREVWES